MDLKTQLETVAKNHQASIQNLETKFDRLADKQFGRPSGSLSSNTQNPKGHNSKAYQPPQSRNEHVNDVFTRSGKSYNSPVNLNDQQTNSETLINFDIDDEDEEPTPQPKTQNPKPLKETPLTSSMDTYHHHLCSASSLAFSASKYFSFSSACILCASSSSTSIVACIFSHSSIWKYLASSCILAILGLFSYQAVLAVSQLLNNQFFLVFAATLSWFDQA
ncbi:hypothetical protein Tco_0652065 [Tanacetum coccineum]|uniref:Uncharacterized protein n=1 Tax=Tanacetum coccineum TaxID=301880 RepID=A0ABQ4WWI6_9ASTR